MRRGTQVVRAGLPPPVPGAPFLPGPVFAGAFHAPGDPAGSSYTYGRFHNPTWTAYEDALSSLEGGEAVIFASGMAAVAAIFGSVLRPGDAAVLPSDSYYTTRLVANGYFREMGIEIRTAPTAGNAQKEHLPGARLLWLETPANPGGDLCDLGEMIHAAHAAGTLVAVDNTTATFLAQQPLLLGADFSLASDSKALTGHHDLILGHVATRDPEWSRKLRLWRTHMGAVPGPMEVWLAHRSLSTLDVRWQRQCANAQTIAEFLFQKVRVDAQRPAVLAARYPGLPQDPAHAVALRQMTSFGTVLNFTLVDADTAQRFLSACRLVIEATSFGGVHTTAERRARWGGDAVADGLIRLSAGCEEAADLIEDLEQALAAAG